MKGEKNHAWNFSIAVIGCGNMGAALATGFSHRLGMTTGKFILCDTDASKIERLSKSLEAIGTTDAVKAASDADIVVLAVKPKFAAQVLGTVRDAMLKRKSLLVSVVGGVTIQEFREVLGKDARVVRVMPNLPCLVGAGLSALYGGTDTDLAAVQTMFESVGRTVRVQQEADLDAVTALGGSAPAFVFQFIEALADGGVKMGLPREQAQEIAIQTVLGSASMAGQTGLHPAQLKDMVASPGGTTIAGLHVLEQAGVRGALMSAIEAATLKAAERRLAGTAKK